MRGRVAALLLLASAACSKEPLPGIFLANATVYDGSGSPGTTVSVRVVGDQIVAVGEVQPDPSDWYLDVSGLALAPGFVDTHSHADRDLAEHPDALAAVSQGITTVVVGQDGSSPWPLADFFAGIDSNPVAVNVAAYAGHGTLRRAVLGEDYRRPATRVELDSMRMLLYHELDAGALGLSTGLEYDLSHSASTEEVLTLAQVVSAEGGRYISHIRSEDREFWEAVDEIIRIGREAGLPVQISHLKLAMRSLWGQADILLAVLDSARAAGVDITADLYPYPYWQSTMRVLFPERNWDNLEAARFAVTEVATPDGILVSRYAPDTNYQGRTLADLAARRREPPERTLMALIAIADSAVVAGGSGAEAVIVTSMAEPDIDRLLQWPFANIGSDGELAGRHPRGYGTFPRVLGRYVREQRLLPLEEAIRRMTSLAARNVGLVGRGVIAAGAAADLVLFDPELVADRATIESPQALAAGIRSVWVNGELVYEEGRPTGRRPGRALRRISSPSAVP